MARSVITTPGGPNDHDTRFDYEGNAGNPGLLTMWRTALVDGAPDQAGRVEVISAKLPNMQNAVINDVFAGAISGLDLGTFGTFYLDELSFRR